MGLRESVEPVEELSPPPIPARRRAPNGSELVSRARTLRQRLTELTAELASDPDLAASGMLRDALGAPSSTTGHRRGLARVFGVRVTAQGLLFVQPANGVRAMAVAGDFNLWNPALHPMRLDPQQGVWQACIPVAPGRYAYRLVMDGRWLHDPFNSYIQINPFGEFNSIVEVP